MFHTVTQRHHEDETPHGGVSLFLWGVLGLILIPWAWLQVNQAVHSDVLWICEAFIRVMEGYRMSDFIYETNPPLNLFTDAIPVLITRWTGIPLNWTLFGYMVGAIGLSAWVIRSILTSWGFLGKSDIFIALAGLILVNTISTGNQFGERDAFTGLALVPFVLTQIAITYRLPMPRHMTWPVLLIGAVFILLKPHHGLIPTILLVHRMIVQRRWTVFRDADFIALSLMTLGYIGMIWFFFRDYIQVILPDVVGLYLDMRNDRSAGAVTALYLYTLAATALFPFIVPMRREKRCLILFLLGCAAVSLIPFYVQGMAYSYHLFPVRCFAACAVAMLALSAVKRYARAGIAAFFVIVVLAGFVYTWRPLNPDYPRPADYATLPLTKVIAPCIGKPECSFFIFQKNMGITHETAQYTGVRYASRFAALWFLPTLMKMEEDPAIPQEKAAHLRKQFSAMVTEDFNRQKPAFAIIIKGLKIGDKPFDFVRYFSAYAPFRKEWAHYRKTGSLEMTQRDYFRGSEYDDDTVLEYDVYERIAEK